MSYLKFIVIFSVLFFLGCSGVVHSSFHSITGFSDEMNLEDFLTSFNETMKKDDFSIRIVSQEKQKGDENVIRTDGETYFILLEAKKESFTKALIVRICENRSEKVFIQLVQSTILASADEKDFYSEYEKIDLLFKKKYPSLKLEVIKSDAV